MKTINLFENSIEEAEIREVSRVLKSKWILNGPEVAAFENELGARLQVDHVVAVSSCTAGIHACLSYLDFSGGGEVILPALNFIAVGMAVLQANATPVFCDIAEDGTIDVEDMKAKISDHTKAVIPLHYAGKPADLTPIVAECAKRGIQVIQDCAHAMGSQYQDRVIGSFDNASVFSFGPSKHLVTAKGGAVATNDGALAESIRSFRSYGMERSSFDRRTDETHWHYDVKRIGHNFRMSDVEAAMGRVQLTKLDEIVEQRRDIAALYETALSGNQHLQPLHSVTMKDCMSAFLYFVVRLNEPTDRDPLVKHLNESGINASVHWAKTLNQHDLFKKFTSRQTIPVAVSMAERVLTLPLHQHMTPDDVDRVVGAVEAYFDDN